MLEMPFVLFTMPLWVSRTGSASDWCALREALYKCMNTIQYNCNCMSNIVNCTFNSVNCVHDNVNCTLDTVNCMPENVNCMHDNVTCTFEKCQPHILCHKIHYLGIFTKTF